MDINTTNIIGRLTKDAELTYAGSGAAIVNFSIAVDHMKKKDGSADTSFLQCKVFGKLGETLAKYMTKGKQVAIRGYLKQERWEKDGQKQSRVVINCEEIELLGGMQSNGNNAGYGNDNGYGNGGYGNDPYGYN
jgi:single-strand DNA-binding protein